MNEANSQSSVDQITAPLRLLVHTIAVRWRTATLAGIFGQPVMMNDAASPYRDYEESSGLESHQNSILLGFNLHPRVSLAGRVDRYYHYSDPQGEGYSYGVILRPKNFDIGVEYQRFPASGVRVWHPLDRRTDQSVSAGIAFGGRTWKVTSQMNNLAMASDSADLEPRIGAEWRPWQHLGLRGGLVSFSDAERWAWTSGISLLDANAFHARPARLPVPDDVVQFAVAVQYDRRTPQVGMASLSLSWRL